MIFSWEFILHDEPFTSDDFHTRENLFYISNHFLWMVFISNNFTWDAFHSLSFANHNQVRILIQQKIFKPLGISLGLKAQQPKSSRFAEIPFFNHVKQKWIFSYIIFICDRNDSVILDAQRDGVTDSVAIAKKTGLQVNLLKTLWSHRQPSTMIASRVCLKYLLV